MFFYRLIVAAVFLSATQILTGAEEKKTEPYLFVKDFEDGNDPTAIWTSNVKKYNINFKGVTEEKAFSGKKSFKCDFTYQGGHYIYLKFPLPKKIPAEGNLKFSARIFIDDKSTGCAKLGGVYSGTIRNEAIFGGSCPIYGAYAIPKGEWVLVESDVVNTGKEIMEKILWGLKNRESAGKIYLDFLGIYIIGGSSVVAYIDDIRIEGEIPTGKTYKEMTEQQTAAFLKESGKKLAEWETALNKMRKSLETFNDEDSKKKYVEQINQLSKRILEIKTKGFIRKKDYEEISNAIRELDEEVSFLAQ